MDEYKVKITPQASAQMLEIFSYINDILKEPVTATRLFDELKSNILSLDKMPKRVALVDEEPWKNTAYIKCRSKTSLSISG